MQKLTDNEYGFEIEKDNPFQVFRILQHYAEQSVGIENVIDLSRGDPGYGFTPSVTGREFLSFLLMLDTYFNNTEGRYTDTRNRPLEETLTEIREYAATVYNEQTLERNMAQLDAFLKKTSELTGRSAESILFEIFKFGTVSGGSYHNPFGEELAREVIAATVSKSLKHPVKSHEINFCNGANHAIGAVFEVLGEEGLGYLKEGDTVAIGSPVYAPYNHILNTRGYNVKTFNIDFINGEIDEESLKRIEDSEDQVKMILIIDPNNPTGYGATNQQLQRLADVAAKQDSLIVSDEVYYRFFPETKESIADYAPERTLRISALTKIERAAGLRFGFFTITDQANEHITKNILKLEDKDFRHYMHFGKSPGGGIEGYFQHVTFVPALCQYMGVAHTVLASQEKDDYVTSVSGNMRAFTSELELPHEGNMYYIIFDLEAYDVPIEKKLVDLAKLGVVYIPAYLFFSEEQRLENKNKFLHTVRASVVNTSESNVRKAAEITKKYLTS